MAGDKHQRMLLRLTDGQIVCHANGKEQNVGVRQDTDGSIQNADEATEALRSFIDSTGLEDQAEAWCFIPARGVTLRRVKLPPTTPANREQFLRLQIEKEFPLSPDELAWGWRQVDQQDNGAEVLVAAVKEDLIRPWADLLHAAGLRPRFVPTVLAEGLCAAGSDNSAVVQTDGTALEIARFEGRHPVGVRTFSRNGDDHSRLADRIVRAASQATRIKLSGDDALTAAVTKGFSGKVEKAEDGGPQRWDELVSGGKIHDLPVLRLNEAASATSKRKLDLPFKWIALAAALMVCLVGARYVGPFIGEARLKRELAAIEEKQAGFPAINQEVNFLQHIQQNQPPYLAALAVFGDAAPRGVKIESLNMDRRGEFSFRGQMQSSQQASDLRKKLIESGLFSNVVLEEQSTVPNKRQVNVRFTARWNTDPKAKSDALKRIDAKGKEGETKKSSIPRRR